jgi:hypothetical protein
MLSLPVVGCRLSVQIVSEAAALLDCYGIGGGHLRCGDN